MLCTAWPTLFPSSPLPTLPRSPISLLPFLLTGQAWRSRLLSALPVFSYCQKVTTSGLFFFPRTSTGHSISILTPIIAEASGSLPAPCHHSTSHLCCPTLSDYLQAILSSSSALKMFALLSRVETRKICPIKGQLGKFFGLVAHTVPIETTQRGCCGVKQQQTIYR